MATWDDVYQAYQQASREDLIAASREATLKVLDALIEKFGEEDAFIAYMAVIGTFICADNKVDYVEYEFGTVSKIISDSTEPESWISCNLLSLNEEECVMNRNDSNKKMQNNNLQNNNQQNNNQQNNNQNQNQNKNN